MKFFPFNYCPFRFMHLSGSFRPAAPCECGYGAQTFDSIPDDVNYNVPPYGSLPSDIELNLGCIRKHTQTFIDPDEPPREWKKLF